MANYYDLLGIQEDASTEDIRRAYRNLAKKYHPDLNNSHDAQTRFILINQAYGVLMDKRKRYLYDQNVTVPKDPYHNYSQWAKEQQARQEAEERRRYAAFMRRKEEIRTSKLYYPYMATMYIICITMMGLSVLVLAAGAIAIVRYHIFMFFFLLPFICGAAAVLKITLDAFKKYKALFAH